VPVALYGYELDPFPWWKKIDNSTVKMLAIRSSQAAPRPQLSRLRVCESRVMRRIFGSKGAEGTGGWRMLHTEEVRNWYRSSNVIRMIRWRKKSAVHVAHPWDMRDTRKEAGNWVHLVQDSDQWHVLVKTVMDHRVYLYDRHCAQLLHSIAYK
jgi:hypothetical protein